LQKYGAYLHFSDGEYSLGRYEGTLAFAGEYHGAIISREFVYLQNNYSNRRFNIYQSADLDINRDWRREKSSESISLTNLYINSNYQVSSFANVGVSLDQRKNYYTYEIRSLADSLFDDAMRVGLRGNMRLKLPGRLQMFGNVGWRKLQQDDKNALSFALGVNKNDFTALRLFAGFDASSFSNRYSNGFHGSFRLGKYFRNGHDVELAFGTYRYSLVSATDSRQNQWVRLNCSLQVLKSFFFTEQYEYSWGNEAAGHRFYFQLGHRF
jgi:hypothetical protein